MKRAFVFVLPLLGLVQCEPDRLDGQCASDDECPSERPRCILDIKTGTDIQSYCSNECGSNSDCPAERECRDEGGLSLCIDRVRVCEAEDPVNGLDDNCDGAVDTGSEIRRCNEDDPCGAFVCRPFEGDDATVCAPANPNATVPYFSPCTQDSQCLNGVCLAGFCSPLCRGDRTSCQEQVVRLDTGVERSTLCAQGIDSESRPAFNTCQLDCFSMSCPDPTECVWRERLGPQDGIFHFVCAYLPEGLKELGEVCSSGNECQHGLCFQGVCTRRCGGGDGCFDVGNGTSCLNTTLTARELENFICRRP